MEIREATADDWPAIWPFFREIVAAGETYTFDPGITSEEARRLWMVHDQPMHVAVAATDARVVGTANVYPNRGGPGSHVATASFMVDPACAGHGIGRALGEHIVTTARRLGFRAIQFQAVVATNTAAVNLWTSLGFEIVGTIPEAFEHPTAGYVGLHVMYLRL